MQENPLRDVKIGVSDVYAPAVSQIQRLFHSTIRILVVVDGGLSLTEEPVPPTDLTVGFGVARIVRLLRESKIACLSFEVDTARREGSTSGSPKYTNFRFDMTGEHGEPVLNHYHQVWCFGFQPGNFALQDADIEDSQILEGELTALVRWMNEKRGGVLAMGDHDKLGASMCHRIPRVRTMRRWTEAQGVPPVDTFRRNDTNQPATLGQQLFMEEIPFHAQQDAVPQPIDWVPWVADQVNMFQIHHRPHPILCHPVHGPINVLPDHPHEGWCYEDNEIALDAPLGIENMSGDEYPSVGGERARPMVIAHGTTTPDPPYKLEKGRSAEKRFAMISVYDGYQVNVGRVVTDSTWHHWFDQNIYAIEGAGGVVWEKISTYYLNVARWLGPVSLLHHCMVSEVLTTHFTYLGFQEYGPNGSIFELGKPLHTYLGRRVGPCWVTEWVFEQVRLVDADLWSWFKKRMFFSEGPTARDEQCLVCPPLALLEMAVLGGVVKSSLGFADRIKKQMLQDSKARLDLQQDEILEQHVAGVRLGIRDFRSSLSSSIKDMQHISLS